MAGDENRHVSRVKGCWPGASDVRYLTNSAFADEVDLVQRFRKRPRIAQKRLTAALNFSRAPPYRWQAQKWREGVSNHEVRQHTDAW